MRYGIFFIFAFSLCLKPLRACNLKWLAALFIYCIFLSVLNGFDIQMRRSMLNLFSGFLFVKIVSDHFQSSSLKKIGYWLLAILILNCAFSAQQYFKVDPLFTTDPNLGPKDSIAGLFKNKVHLGVFISIISPFIFNIFPPLALVPVPLLCASNSSTAIVSFLISIGFLIYFRVRKLFFLIFIAVLAVSASFYVWKYDAPGGQFGERFKIWNAVYSIALTTHPYVGNGIGSFARLNLQSTQKTTDQKLEWVWVHNEYLQAFFEFGAMGLAIIFFYVKDCFAVFIKHYQDNNLKVIFSSLVAVFILSFFHFPFHIARLAIPSLFVMGLFHARLKDLENAC